jgi:hypothetical protein
MKYTKLNSSSNLFAGDILRDVAYCNDVQIKIFVDDKNKFDYEPSSVHVIVTYVMATWTTKGYKLQDDLSL